MRTVDNFIDLTDELDTFEFSHPPLSVWLIFSLEFPALFCDEKFLLVTQPYYGDINSKANFGEGIWYPPFSAFPIDIRFFPIRNLGDLRRKLEEVEQEKFHSEFVDAMAYNLGLGEPRYERIAERPIDEYKLSPRGHNAYKFFRLVRYRCWHLGASKKRDLVDPESLKGLTYVPLRILETASQSDCLGPHSHIFFSKVVATHFERLSRTYRGERSTDKYTILSRSDLVNAESGYLLFFDVSGFGRAEAAMRERSFHPIQSSFDIAQSFRARLSEIFLDFFQTQNLSQYVTLGDGFIAGVPYRIIENKDTFYGKLSESLKRLCSSLNELNGHLVNSGEAVGLRACIVEGEYRYGKIAGLSSLRSEFDGTLLIDAARLDSGAKDSLSPGERRGHLVVASYSRESLNIGVCGDVEVKELLVTVKETSATAVMKVLPLSSVARLYS